MQKRAPDPRESGSPVSNSNPTDKTVAPIDKPSSSGPPRSLESSPRPGTLSERKAGKGSVHPPKSARRNSNSRSRSSPSAVGQNVSGKARVVVIQFEGFASGAVVTFIVGVDRQRILREVNFELVVSPPSVSFGRDFEARSHELSYNLLK